MHANKRRFQYTGTAVGHFLLFFSSAFSLESGEIGRGARFDVAAFPIVPGAVESPATIDASVELIHGVVAELEKEGIPSDRPPATNTILTLLTGFRGSSVLLGFLPCAYRLRPSKLEGRRNSVV